MTAPVTQQPQRIWRINAYLILIAGVLAIAALALGLAGLVWDLLRPRVITNVVAPAGDARLRQERLSYHLRNAQGDVVVLDVLSDQTLDTAYSAKTLADTLRNQLFVTLADGRSTRLLADNQRLIVRVWAIRNTRVTSPHRSEHGDTPGESPDDTQPVRARLYEVVDADRNGDTRLSPSDPRRLLLARADGSAPVTLAENITQLDAPALGAAGELRLAATQADGGTHLYRFDLHRWTALPPVALPSPSNP